MSKSKVHMPKELKKKCHIAIHTASAAAAAAGAIPIPMSDAIPITAAQIGMVIAIGKAYDVAISETAARSIMGLALTQQVGRAVCSSILKVIPVAGSVISAAIAASLTEALGWLVADDFFRIAIGENPENLLDAAGELKDLFGGVRYHKYKNTPANRKKN